MRLLYCDPSLSSTTARAVVSCVYGDCPGAVRRRVTLTDPRSETILQQFDQLLGQEPLDALVLVNQAKSFTLIRVLVTLYNALAYSRKVPLYELATAHPFEQLAEVLGKPQTQLKPHYLKAPTITYAVQSGK